MRKVQWLGVVDVPSSFYCYLTNRLVWIESEIVGRNNLRVEPNLGEKYKMKNLKLKRQKWNQPQTWVKNVNYFLFILYIKINIGHKRLTRPVKDWITIIGLITNLGRLVYDLNSTKSNYRTQTWITWSICKV